MTTLELVTYVNVVVTVSIVGLVWKLDRRLTRMEALAGKPSQDGG